MDAHTSIGIQSLLWHDACLRSAVIGISAASSFNLHLNAVCN